MGTLIAVAAGFVGGIVGGIVRRIGGDNRSGGIAAGIRGIVGIFNRLYLFFLLFLLN
jgi:hypothetical protein